GELAKAAIDKEATRFRLRQDFVSRFLGDVDDENSLLKLALNRGWLNCVGIDTNRKPVYAFFHASFQEYFAAIAIDDWHFFLNHVPKNPSQGTYRIFEPQWKQTILLWLGREEENIKQQKQLFIDALVNFKDGWGKWNIENWDKGFYEYYAYSLAALGIAEFDNCSKADEIVKQIVKWCFGYFNIIKQEWTWAGFSEEGRHEVKPILQQTDRKKAIAALVQLLQSPDMHDFIRNDVVESLGKIGTGNEFVIAALLQLLQSPDVDDYDRRKVAESLEKIATGNEFAIAALVQLLQSPDVDEYIRTVAGKSLEKIGTGNEFVITAFVQLLQSPDVGYSNRRWAAYILDKIGNGNEFAIAALVQLLQSPNVGNYTRRLVAESLEKIGTGNEFAITALSQLLQSTDLNDDNHWWAVYILDKIGVGNKFTITALVQLLQFPDANDSTCWQTTNSLGHIGT
ncbi:MAG: HEAT repeat domain-containing protein, partial [Nostoc sp.]